MTVDPTAGVVPVRNAPLARQAADVVDNQRRAMRTRIDGLMAALARETDIANKAQLQVQLDRLHAAEAAAQAHLEDL